jgi:hypothetical protein
MLSPSSTPLCRSRVTCAFSCNGVMTQQSQKEMKKHLTQALVPFVVGMFLLSLGASALAQSVSISGELKRWHKVTLTLDGPTASEGGTPNPFMDYRMNVTFSNTTSGLTYKVPGYFAADGNAAETSATSGNKWRAHLSPDDTGTWTYTISFRSGANVSVDASATAGSALAPYDGVSGSFNIAETDKTGRDFRGKGRLKYVNKHHLRFADGTYFVKAGADAPENFLAYDDFDNTPTPAVAARAGARTCRTGMPATRLEGHAGQGHHWRDQLSLREGLQRAVVPHLQLQRRRQERVPVCEPRRPDADGLLEAGSVGDRVRAGRQDGGVSAFQDPGTENDQDMDGGALGNERKLYYRELIARFGHHLALNWNLGEENTNTDAQRKAFAQFFYDHDPYRHHVVLHTFPGAEEHRLYTLAGNGVEIHRRIAAIRCECGL